MIDVQDKLQTSSLEPAASEEIPPSDGIAGSSLQEIQQDGDITTTEKSNVECSASATKINAMGCQDSKHEEIPEDESHLERSFSPKDAEENSKKENVQNSPTIEMKSVSPVCKMVQSSTMTSKTNVRGDRSENSGSVDALQGLGGTAIMQYNFLAQDQPLSLQNDSRYDDYEIEDIDEEGDDDDQENNFESFNSANYDLKNRYGDSRPTRLSDMRPRLAFSLSLLSLAL